MAGLGTGPPGDPGGGRKQIMITNLENVRKLTVTATDPNVKLSELSPFALSRYIGFIIQTSGPVAKPVKQGRVVPHLFPSSQQQQLTFDAHRRSGRGHHYDGQR